MKRLSSAAAAGALVLAACSSSSGRAVGRPSTATTLAALGARPCANDATFLCVALRVPLDHFGAPNGKTLDVTFAVRPAPEATRRGMLVTADGGPGYAGTDDLSTWSGVDPRFPAEQDLVYFDLRGVKASGHLECKRAASAFYRGGLRVAGAADETALTSKAETFARDCIAEMGIPASEVPFYETAQAIEDLEAFRVAMGVDALSLYGLSYGTQLMQAYAAHHGDHVRALVLDGTVDLTLGHVAYMTDLDRSIEDLLDRTLAECAARPGCARHYDGARGRTPEERVRSGYAAVAAALDAGAVTLDFPLDAGSTSRRLYSRADLDTTTFNSLGDPASRAALLSALAPAFERGDFMPLLRLSYASGGVDAQTAGPIGTAGADPGMSDAVYYSFTCNDYGSDAPTASTRQAEYLAGGRALWGDPRVLSPYYGDDPCAYWPVTRVASRAPPAPLPGIPTLVIGATGDGSVPHDQGESVAARLADGYLIEVEGGHHVMYGSGVACVDEPATAFLLDLERPSSRSIRCAGELVADR